MAAPTITCRKCGTAVSLMESECMIVWSPRGARVRCDNWECQADLGLLRAVVEYLERRQPGSVRV